MNGGSQNLRRFRIAMRDGASIEEAADIAGMTIGEARIHAKRDDENPPPEDAFQLIGHNSRGEPTMAQAGDDRLRLLIERIERLEEERKGISDDIKDVFSEAKAVGYDVKILRKVLKLRKMSADDRREMDVLLQTYCGAVGLQLDLPLAVSA